MTDAGSRHHDNNATDLGCTAESREHDGKGGGMKYTPRPLTPHLWPAFEDLFGESGAVGRCWCMYWRVGRAYRKKPRKENKNGVSGNRGARPAAGSARLRWRYRCGLVSADAARRAAAAGSRAWRLKRVDDAPVWSLSCFYARKGYRRKGVTEALIATALNPVRQRHALSKPIPLMRS
jgi:hypothetical protein